MWEISILADLNLWNISFHAVVVFGLGKNLLFKSVLGHCGPKDLKGLGGIFSRSDSVKEFEFLRSFSKATENHVLLYISFILN